MSEPTETLPTNVADAVDALAAALRASPAFVAYTEAEAALCADAAAASILEQFVTAQRELRARQMDGTISQAHLSLVRELEQQMQANAVITTFLAAQQHVLARLPRVNGTISEGIGINFAQLARRSSCC